MITQDQNSKQSARSTSGDKPSSQRRGVSALLHDAIALIELQGKLFVHDLHQLRTGAGPALLMLTLGAVLCFATVPVLLLGLSALLVVLSGWPVWVSTITVGLCCGVIPALGLLIVGWKVLQRRAGVMSRSTTELRRNTDWLKRRIQSSL